MGRLKRYRSSRAVASLLLLLALWGSPHKQQDDAACLPQVGGQHDASKHAIAAPDATHRDHCAICHWVRGLKPSFTVACASAVELRAAADVVATDTIAADVSSVSRLPARAPPSTLL